MQFSDIISPEVLKVGLKILCKERVLQKLSQLLSLQLKIPSEEIFEGLNQREQVETTGFGNGIAIPHYHKSNLKKSQGACVILTSPIDFNATDGMPVDIIFALITPESSVEHLRSLAYVARFFDQENNRKRIRHAQTEEALFALFCHVSEFP